MTMTLLSVVRDVCAVVGITQPSSVISGIAGNRTMQEILALANEMAQRIAYDTRDWTKLKKITDPYLTGDDVTTAFSLPADFKRLLLTSNVWRSTSTMSPMRFIPDLEQWMNRRAGNTTNTAWGEWTMYNNQIHIYPTLAGPIYVDPLADPLVIDTAAETAYFTYLSKSCISLAGGGVGHEFVADGDSFILDERVLKLGMIWQWKAQKGAPYAEDMGTYGDALTNAMGHDTPGPIYIDRYPISAAANVAYPWGTP